MTRFLLVLLAWAVPFGLALAACSPAPSAPPTEAPPPDTPLPDAPLPDAGPPGDGVPFASQDDYRQQRADAVARLDAAAGAGARAASACYAVPVGAKACGGPASFVVASRESSDSLVVARLAARVTALDRRAIDQFNLGSTCNVVVAPETALRGGRCVAVE